jgi:tetratricopeptide (TPR) repeat protein
VFASLPAWAGFIRGQVRYENRLPADRVVVRLRSDVVAFQTETQTDPQGKFEFGGLPLTTFHLTIEGQGFRPYESHIDISISKLSYELITLKLDKREEESKAVPPEGPAATLNARIAQIPSEARKEFEAGQRRMKAHDNTRSLEHFQKAIALYPQFAEAYQLMGAVHIESGELSNAEADLQKSIEIEPNLSRAHFALGMCRNLMAKYTQAEAALLRFLELDPEASDGFYELGKAYWGLGRLPEARQRAERAVVLNPKLAGAHVLLGDIALHNRDADTALKEYKQALRVDSKGPMAAATQQMVKRIEDAQRAN